ncbi:MAG: hypothetical protein ABI988_11345 [Nitrospirota bacterium]
MKLLLVLAMSLVALPLLAADNTPSIFSTPPITMVHPMPGMDYLYNQRGESTTILQPLPGLSWYSQEDRFGRITNQGYLFDPFGPREPLQVPSVDRYAPERDRYTR